MFPFSVFMRVEFKDSFSSRFFNLNLRRAVWFPALLSPIKGFLFSLRRRGRSSAVAVSFLI